MSQPLETGGTPSGMKSSSRASDNDGMKRSLLELALLAMSSTEFEDLAYALVSAEHPQARRLKPPDGGRDTIVAPTTDEGELVWQVKHHTKEINWSKCRASLKKATEKREPARFTFVFPLDMTETKEPGLQTLRADFPDVEIVEPWGASAIAERLNSHDDIRRSHIDSVIGVDHQFAERMLERGAELKSGWDLQTNAAIEGPLVALGLAAAAAEAAALASEDPGGACGKFEELAESLSQTMPSISDVLLLQAATCAKEAGKRSRSGELYLRASRGAAERGDPVAEYAAFRALWELPAKERWRADAALARAVWPERGADALAALLMAFERALTEGKAEPIIEWSQAYCEVAAANDRWDEIRDVAGRAVMLLGPVTGFGGRLEIELEHLDARARDGEDVGEDFDQLLLGAAGREDGAAGLIYARRACLLAAAGDSVQAITRFREAARRWRAAVDCEEEIGEAVFSEDAVAQLLEDDQRLDQVSRIAAADLRGRGLTMATLADRREAEGLRAWLEDRGYDARRLLTLSWSIHRRAGHLGGAARLATALRSLFTNASEWPEALTWAIRSGSYKGARDAAAQLAWPDVRARLRLTGPPWELGPSLEALAKVGSLASDEEVSALAPKLLAVASGRSGEAHVRDKADVAARRALAVVLCAVPEGQFARALEEVVHETNSTPYPPVQTLPGLMLATDAGLCDCAKLATEFFCIYDRAHLGGRYHNLLDLIHDSPPSKAHVLKLADDVARAPGRPLTALILAAWLDLPDESAVVARGAASAVTRALTGELGAEEILRHGDRGRLAHWARPDDQERCAAGLVAILAEPEEIDTHRYEAAEALQSLAARLEELTAAKILDQLLAAAEQIGQPSLTEGFQSHPNRHFARVLIDTPSAGPQIRAIALRATCSLAVRCGREDDVRDAANEALGSEEGALRAAAVTMATQHPGLLRIDVGHLLDDEDSLVRARAFDANSEQHAVAFDDPRLLALCNPAQPLMVRSTVLHAAKRSPAEYKQALKTLTTDPHVYVRAAARIALGRRCGAP